MKCTGPIFALCFILTVPTVIQSAVDEIFWEPYSFGKEKNLIQDDIGRILVEFPIGCQNPAFQRNHGLPNASLECG